MGAVSDDLAQVSLGILEDLARGQGILNLDKLLELIMDAMITLTGAQRGFLVIENGQGRLRFAAARNFQRGEVVGPEGQLSFTVVQDVAVSRQPVLLYDAQFDDRYGAAESVKGLGVKSVCCCPLVSLRGTVQGVCYLDDLRQSGQFDEDDLRMLVVFASQCATALENTRLYDRLDAQETRLAGLEQLRQEFIQALAHELRTPLSTVKGALDLLNLPTEPEGRATLIETAQKGLDRFVRVIKRLLEFASEEMASAIQPMEELRPFAVRLLVAEWVDVLGPQIKEKGLRVVNDVPADFQCMVVPTRLSRALGAVLENAVQYNVPQGSITIEAGRLRPQSGGDVPAVLLQGGRYNFIRIQDTGEGIPAEELPYVFDRFFRGEKHRAVGGGLGLGLSMAQRDCAAQEGALLLHSEEGRGTTVTIYLQAVLSGT